MLWLPTWSLRCTVLGFSVAHSPLALCCPAWPQQTLSNSSRRGGHFPPPPAAVCAQLLLLPLLLSPMGEPGASMGPRMSSGGGEQTVAQHRRKALPPLTDVLPAADAWSPHGAACTYSLLSLLTHGVAVTQRRCRTASCMWGLGGYSRKCRPWGREHFCLMLSTSLFLATASQPKQVSAGHSGLGLLALIPTCTAGLGQVGLGVSRHMEASGSQTEAWGPHQFPGASSSGAHRGVAGA